MSSAEKPAQAPGSRFAAIPGHSWFDAYSVKAHWAPILAVSGAPIFTSLAALPTLTSAKGAATAVLLFCLPPALGFIARNRGKRLEADLWAKCGGKSTVRFLRHRDTSIPEQTKARYFDFLAAAGIKRPTQAEEAKDPEAADAIYASAGDWLRRHTRTTGSNPHADRQNAAYGFARNLLGMRRPGLIFALASAFCAAAVLIARYSSGGDMALLAAALSIDLIMAAVWWRAVTPEAVKLADEAYGLAILEGCEPEGPTSSKAKPAVEGSAAKAIGTRRPRRPANGAVTPSNPA